MHHHIRCAAGQRCRAYSPTDGPAPAHLTPLCEACLAGCAQTIHKLMLDWYDLEQTLARAASVGEVVSGTRDRPIPIRQDVEALQAEIRHVLCTWEQILRDHEHLSPPAPGRVRPGYAVQRAVRLLVPFAPVVACIPPVPVRPTGPTDAPEMLTGSDGLLGMVRLHGRAHYTLGLTAFTNSLPGECAQCGMAELATADGDRRLVLARADGSDTVFCRHCGDRRTRDEYERYALLVATDYVNNRRRRSA